MAQFDDLVDARIWKIKAVLGAKGAEYSAGDDRFHNFNLAAQIWGISPEEALWGMALKHLVSVIDLVEAPELATEERVDEKIGDMINYLILLEGLLWVRREGTGRDKEGSP